MKDMVKVSMLWLSTTEMEQPINLTGKATLLPQLELNRGIKATGTKDMTRGKKKSWYIHGK